MEYRPPNGQKDKASVKGVQTLSRQTYETMAGSPDSPVGTRTMLDQALSRSPCIGYPSELLGIPLLKNLANVHPPPTRKYLLYV